MIESKYPIICAPMNGVYSYSFAKACLDSGIVYGSFFTSIPLNDLKSLISLYDTDKFYITLSSTSKQEFLKQVKQAVDIGLKNIEIPSVLDSVYDRNLIENIVGFLKKNNCRVFCKRKSKFADLYDGILVKGSESAARSSNLPLLQEFTRIQSTQKLIIASGGIYSGKQVKHYLDSGAIAVCIGTLFAASMESPLSDQAKQKIIQSTVNDLSRFKNSQQALVFSEFPNDDENNTTGLINGIQTGNQGHLFLGHAVDHITEIKPVAEIVAELSSHLV